jgi:hypothetical protein
MIVSANIKFNNRKSINGIFKSLKDYRKEW